ncbi:MAG: hypothetical protein ACFCBV_12130 [Phycisphaerales bacterium]
MPYQDKPKIMDRCRTRVLLMATGALAMAGGCSYGGSQGYSYGASHGYTRIDTGAEGAIFFLGFYAVAAAVAWCIDACR